jgi:TatD DNase family protein
MASYFDIHTHQTATAQEVCAILNIDINLSENQTLPQKPISVGLHPWTINASNQVEKLAQLSEYLANPWVRLLGECGLDKICETNFALQLRTFEQQIKLAVAIEKPIIIHCVKAYDELIAVKKSLKPKVPMIIHGFNKHLSLAKTLIHQGFYLSFGAALINHDKLESYFKDLPLDRIFLETDDSTCRIADVYQAAANAKDITISDLQNAIRNNWTRLGLFEENERS